MSANDRPWPLQACQHKTELDKHETRAITLHMHTSICGRQHIALVTPSDTFLTHSGNPRASAGRPPVPL